MEKKRQQESLNNKNCLLRTATKIPSISEEELSLTDKIYLASLLRECLHEDAEYIEEVNQKVQLLLLILSLPLSFCNTYYLEGSLFHI